MTIFFLLGLVIFGGIAKFFFLGVAEVVGLFGPLILLFGVLLAKWLFLWFLHRQRIFFKV